MTRIVGVRFRSGGKVYYFDPKDYEITKEDHVIVETARGIEYGRIVLTPREVEDDKVVHPLKEVLRVANEEDDRREKENREKEREAFRVCRQKIREHNLDMKLIDAEYTFDNNKVLFYFTADGRIDFRLLVKDLASIFKTRIELRQIGVRDETKILGGIGICGRSLCCHSYLTDFAPVSIKMAKEQNLSLNQTKISGVCGRLMCCLKNEQQTYEELNKRLPNIGDGVVIPDGMEGTVHSVNVLRQTVRVMINVDDEKEIQEYPVDEIQVRFHRRKGKDAERDPEQGKKPEEQRAEKKKPEKNPEKNSERKNSEKRSAERKNPENGSREKKNPETGSNHSQERKNAENGSGNSLEKKNSENGGRRRRRRNQNHDRKPDQTEGTAG